MEINYKFDSQVWWGTPIVKFEQPRAKEFNEALAQIIRLKEREILENGKATKVAGLDDGLTAHWLEYNVLNWDYPECKELARMAVKGFNSFLEATGMNNRPGMTIAGVSCWANILRPGQALQIHHHDPAFVSAHYTVMTGFEAGAPAVSGDSGETVYFRPGFMDRSHGGTQNGWVSPWDDDWRICSKPTAGKMIFFPSYVRHEVRPNLGSCDRISIAMDFFVTGQPSLIYFGGSRWYKP